MCTFIHVHKGACVSALTPMPKCESHPCVCGHPWLSSLAAVLLAFETVPVMAWSSSIWLAWLASEFWMSSCLISPALG